MKKNETLAFGVVSGITTIGGLAYGPEFVEAGNNQVCDGLDSGKIDVSGNVKTISLQAPAGYLIDKVCVKAGSANQGLGPEYIDLVPDVSSYKLSHSSGKDISHYSVDYVKKPETSTTTTTTAPTTTVAPTTTTPATTTTSPSVTTTTLPEVTTTNPQVVNTTTPETPSTTIEVPSTLPATGNSEVTGGLAGAALALALTGAALVRFARR